MKYLCLLKCLLFGIVNSSADFLKGVTPFYESLPSDKKNAFANEYASEVLVLDNMLYKPTFEERYKSPHNVLIVYAKK